jgi:hypothetical protein
MKSRHAGAPGVMLRHDPAICLATTRRYVSPRPGAKEGKMNGSLHENNLPKHVLKRFSQKIF